MTLMTYSDIFIVNFEHISHLFLVFLLLTFTNYMLAKKWVKLWVQSYTSVIDKSITLLAVTYFMPLSSFYTTWEHQNYWQLLGFRRS